MKVVDRKIKINIFFQFDYDLNEVIFKHEIYQVHLYLNKVIYQIKILKWQFYAYKMKQNIPLNQLTYWNVELQEAYFSPKEAQKRYEELNKKWEH